MENAENVDVDAYAEPEAPLLYQFSLVISYISYDPLNHESRTTTTTSVKTHETLKYIYERERPAIIGTWTESGQNLVQYCLLIIYSFDGREVDDEDGMFLLV